MHLSGAFRDDNKFDGELLFCPGILDFQAGGSERLEIRYIPHLQGFTSRCYLTSGGVRSVNDVY